MNKILTVAAEAGYTRLFDLDMQLIHDAILLAIAIFVLFLLLSYLLFNPARKMLEGRRQKIQDELQNAADDKASAAAMKAEYEQKLKNVDKEVEKIIADARQNALIGAAHIEDEARDEAHQHEVDGEKQNKGNQHFGQHRRVFKQRPALGGEHRHHDP